MQIKFDANPNVFAGISERSDGSMVWWNRKPVDEKIRENREKYFAKIGVDPRRVVCGGLTHGTTVTEVSDSEAGEYLLNTDALITKTPNIYLAITAADCTPVYFYDPKTSSVGMVHAGWRGTVNGILENVVRKMQDCFGTKPENLFVVLGPNIKQHHYEVGAEVANVFDRKNVLEEGARLLVDLSGEAELRLRDVGVKNISTDLMCTFCSADRLYSARNDKVEPLEGAVAYIGIAQ